MEVQTKKRIRPILLKMQLWETEIYPVEEIASIRATIQMIHDQRLRKFTTKKEGEILKVTRIA